MAIFRFISNILSSVIFAVCSLIFISPLAAQDNEIVIGTVGGQLDLERAEPYLAFSDYLSASIPDYQFKVVSYLSIESLIEAVDIEELDFAMLTPAAYVELADRHIVRPIATVTQQFDGEVYPWLAGAVFARADRSDITSISDARGKHVIALSELALGGWLSAVREWRALDIDERHDFQSLDFVFSYQTLVDRVCSGMADVGVVGAGIFASLRNSCNVPLKVLPNPRRSPDPRYPVPASTRLYPEVAFVQINSEIEESLVINVTKSLLDIEQGSDVALSATVAGFTPPLSYQAVEGLMQELRLGPYEHFGEITLVEFFQQHSSKVILVMLIFLGVLNFAFVRSQLLNKRLRQAVLVRRMLFEKSNFPIAILEPKNLSFVEMNPAALKIYGFEKEADVIGKLPAEISAYKQKNGNRTEDELKSLKGRLKNNQPITLEWLHLRPDGSTWESEVHLLPIRFEGVDLIQATMMDVTEINKNRVEREKMEQQLRHAQRLESLGRLSGAIAHDFNNLLTVINGYSEMLLMSTEKDSSTYRTLMEIAQAGWRARELTNQLLTFGRRQIGRVQPIDVNTMIMESGNMFRSLLGEKINLKTSLETNLGRVLADSSQLNQVLMNLLVNAKDAMPQGGACTITTGLQSISVTGGGALGLEPGQFVLISVTDTGVGMDLEVQEHIFEPFYSTKGEKGTGIGLATVYGIIRQCKGTITYLSELGVGTTFSIYLPITTSEPNLEEVAEEQAGDLKAANPYTILVVEDQPDVRLYACSVLRSSGYRVLEADSGDKAVSIAREHESSIDLLFTDVVMPGMNGRELAELFQESWPHTKILFTSGYADDEVALHGVVQDKIQFVSKPYVPQHLLIKLREMLS